MRASIRYIRSVADRKLKFRSYEYSGPPRITTYVDASWAAEESPIGRVLQEQPSSLVTVVSKHSVGCSRV